MVLAAPEVPLGVRRYLLELATRAGAFRLASFVSAEIAEARQCGMLGLLDLVSLNESEAAELVGETFSPEKAEGFLQKCQQFLHSSWPNLRMVVSAGAGGAYAVTREMWNYRPAPKVQAVSTAGAGDALLGGIVAAMAAGAPLLKAPELGHALPGAELETALDLGVLLASYKCQSPHTIHPDACLRTLIDFARSRDLSFAPGLQSHFSQTPP